MEDNRVVSINKNKEPEIDSIGFMSKTIDSFPVLERDILRLSLGLREPYEIMHSCDEIAEILNKPKELIDKNWATGMKRLGDIVREEKSKQENEDAYSEIRLQMHNHLIKKTSFTSGRVETRQY
tara:strand:- start:55 stop:426 length:372 start_codon:yes stop_codon:yes gene_type:complete